jgi:hypothetical protein
MGDQKFIDFLFEAAGKIVVNDNNCTHQTLFDPKKKWSINKNHIPAFWNSYCNAVYNNTEALYIAEIPNNVMPLIIDLKFRYYTDVDSDADFASDDNFVKHFVASAQFVICEKFQTTGEDLPELNCVVMECHESWREDSSEGPVIVRKMRIQFPYCRIEKENYLTFRKRLIRVLHERAVLSKLAERPIDTWQGIIGANPFIEPVLMYGSVASPDQSAVFVTRTYGSIDLNDDGDIEDAEEISPDELFNPRAHMDIFNGDLPEDFTDGQPLDFWYPIVMSIGYWRGITRLKNQEVEETVAPQFVFTNDKLRIADELMSIISYKRFMEPIYNREIGRALFNIANEDEIGLELWISHFQRHSRTAKRDEEEVEKDIEKMRVDYFLFTTNNYITEMTLGWYARCDDRNSYDEWHREWVGQTIDETLKGKKGGLHSDVAKAFYRFTWLDFFLATGHDDKTSWYSFTNGHLIRDCQGLSLRKLMSDDFVKMYQRLRTRLSSRAQSIDNESQEAQELNDKIKVICTIIEELKNRNYKTSIIIEAKEHFFRPDFDFEMACNSNLNTMGLRNGVLEVYENECIFRDGKPEDFITLKTSVPFRKDFHWNHKYVKDYLRWIRCVHRDEDLFMEWRKFVASLLMGGNNDKIFPICSGRGGGGKSQMIKGLEQAFGQYCFNLPVEIFTCKNRNPNGPSPLLARGRGKRLAIISEPDDDDPMRKGMIKQISGNDRGGIRGLYEGGDDMVASFVISLWCNGIPVFPNADEALRERMRIYPHLSKWSENVTGTFDEQFKTGVFKRDKFFDRNIPYLAQALLWVAVQDYRIYKDEELQIVPVMKEALDTYWEDVDFYHQYTNDCVTTIENEKGEPNMQMSKTITEVYLNFSRWYKQCYPNAPIPLRPAFVREVSERWGKPLKGKWYGIAFTEELDDDEGANDGGSDILGF